MSRMSETAALSVVNEAVVLLLFFAKDPTLLLKRFSFTTAAKMCIAKNTEAGAWRMFCPNVVGQPTKHAA